VGTHSPVPTPAPLPLTVTVAGDAQVVGSAVAVAALAAVDAAPAVREAVLASADPGPEARTGVSSWVTGPEAVNRPRRLDAGGPCSDLERGLDNQVPSVAEGIPANGAIPFTMGPLNRRAVATGFPGNSLCRSAARPGFHVPSSPARFVVGLDARESSWSPITFPARSPRHRWKVSVHSHHPERRTARPGIVG
jgi:hypothetical protein